MHENLVQVLAKDQAHRLMPLAMMRCKVLCSRRDACAAHAPLSKDCD